jgi:serine-type D-Ala-D-Ala carboxypeptidase (penicillin-binding protein 5/6)
MTTVVKKGATVGQAVVVDGQVKTIAAIAAADAKALVKRGDEGSVKVAFAGQSITAPVTAGQQVGTVVVQQNGQAIAKVPAVAGASVGKQSMWKKSWPF